MDKYRATKIDDSTFYVENGTISEYVRSAHCKCCALANVIQKYGGEAYLRGLHRYGICYQWLAVTSRQQGDEQDEAPN